MEKGRDGLLAVSGDGQTGTGLLQIVPGDFEVQIVVLCKKNPHAGQIRRLFPGVCGDKTLLMNNVKRDGNGKGAADSLRAGDLYGAAHLFHERFHDGHAKPRAVIDGPRVGTLLRKRLEDVLQIFRTHSDARVRDDAGIDKMLFVRLRAGAFPGDGSARLVVLDGIPENIDQDLTKMQRASVNGKAGGKTPLMSQCDSCLGGLYVYDIQNLFLLIRERERFPGQNRLSAFQFAHLRDDLRRQSPFHGSGG